MPQTILHITFEYPDEISPNETKAIFNLIETTPGFKHIIFSLNRSPFFWQKKFIRKNNVFMLQVFRLPFGVLWNWSMKIAAKRIVKLIEKYNLKFDIIHGHKLSMEGLICAYIHNRMNSPYVISIRGNTDVKIARFKPLYRNFYRQILNRSEGVFSISYWPIEPLEKLLNTKIRNKFTLIPNFVPLDKFKIKSPKYPKRLVSVFNLRSIRLKNVHRVILAFNELFNKYPEYTLDIIGDGKSRSHVKNLIDKSNKPENFRLLGHIPNSKLPDTYSDYAGFILPSFPETFGIVFIEALASGIPIIHSKNTSVDGFFDKHDIGIKVYHRSISEIRDAIEEIIEHNELYRENVKTMIKSGELNCFSAKSVSDTYTNSILSKVEKLSSS